jgi:hypothetical protein
MLQDSRANWISTTDNQVSNVCKDDEFNLGKRFTVFKAVNRFPKIKEVFMVKMKIISVDHYFRPIAPTKHVKMPKSFYAETNGTLEKKLYPSSKD